jgi:hypothetical protein
MRSIFKMFIELLVVCQWTDVLWIQKTHPRDVKPLVYKPTVAVVKPKRHLLTGLLHYANRLHIVKRLCDGDQYQKLGQYHFRCRDSSFIYSAHWVAPCAVARCVSVCSCNLRKVCQRKVRTERLWKVFVVNRMRPRAADVISPIKSRLV